MNDLMGTDAPASLVERAKAMILDPKGTWPKIAEERTTPGDLITRYAIPLLAIGPLAAFIGGQLFGFSIMGVTYRPGLMTGLSTAITTFVLGIVGVVVLALIAEFLAPKFGGTADRTNAFKLVAYAMTASWIGGIFGLVPALGIIGLIAAIYALYTLYLGVTPVMKVPEDKAAGYTAVCIIAAILLYLVVGALATSIAGMFGGSPLAAMTDEAEVSGEMTIPGVGRVDVGKLEAAGKKMEAVQQRKAIAGSALQALLPESIGAYRRTAVETVAAGIGSNATGTYEAGGNRFELKITDMAALGALAGIGSAFGVEQSREDANGYERTGTVDGRMQTEEWNKADSRGKFGTVVADRFMVEAEGRAANIDELKAAVAAINADDLAGLAE